MMLVVTSINKTHICGHERKQTFGCFALKGVSVIQIFVVVGVVDKNVGTQKCLHAYCMIFAKGILGNCEAFTVHN